MRFFDSITKPISRIRIMHSLNETELEIKKRLDKYSEQILGPNKKNCNTDLTYSIKEIIGSYGQELGFDVRASGLKQFKNEFLYDIVWYRSNEIGLKNVELVVESELGRGLEVIKYDFEKLLLANAKMRIMICFSYLHGDGIEDIKEFCSNAVKNYDQLEKGSRVFVLIWDDYITGEFVPHLIEK